MHIKDIQAAVTGARQLARKSLTRLEEVEGMLQDADSCIDLEKKLQSSGELALILTQAAERGKK